MLAPKKLLCHVCLSLAFSVVVPGCDGAQPSAKPDQKSESKSDPEPDRSPANNKAKNQAKPEANAKAPPHPHARRPPGGESDKQDSGEPCNIRQRCGAGLGCSGLFHGAEGTCIPEAEAKRKCEAAKGSWGVWGLQQASYCQKRFTDGGKACKDSSECEGRCLKPSTSEQAHCAKHEQSFGCFAEMSQGKPGPTICQD